MYAGQRRTLEIPDENVESVIRIKDFPPLLDLKAAVRDAVENPVGGEKLSDLVKPGGKVVVLTIDRLPLYTSAMNPVVLDVLNEMGVKDQDVTFYLAMGLHGTPADEARIGRSVLQRVKVVKHECDDRDLVEYRGTTRFGTPLWFSREVLAADVRIGIGEVAPHPVAGYMGGSKVILPGVSHRDTIDHNHGFLLSSSNFYGVVDGNIIREDMNDAAEAAGLDMKVDAVINSQQQPVKVAAGDFVKEWKALLPFADQVWSTRMRKKADIAVYHPGAQRERTLMSSLYQSIEAADMATREDGIIVNASSCIDGVAGGWPPIGVGAREKTGPDFLKMSTEDLARLIVRHEVSVRDVVLIYRQKRVLERKRVFVASKTISDEEAREFGFAGSGSLEEVLARAFQEMGRDARVAVMPQEGIAWRTMPIVDAG
ncbi:MAG: lactate racemase domain-containing protein [Candidatus Bathyarchaeia archaeon]